uniref:Cytosolic acetyl-CoA carboxylase 2 n=1 Tax=Lolium rigidum TaxID=89674 RepID=A0A5B9T5R1_LOLRI|nr:cytosolic acetyl-CoA carboxylase 2 [Lolium rigidum]
MVAEPDKTNGTPNRMSSNRHLSSPSVVDEFCKALGGDSPIHSVLVANNGMAAVKFMRSIRTWALETFGTEKAILLVAMATPEDLRINAEHIRIADQFLEVPGGTNNNNYANVQLIVEIAERTRVSAVWPGWGHASENPELPDALKEKGIIFLGPPSAAMAALGDKIGSSLIAQAAGVPTLPWSGSHVKVPQETCHLIPEDIYKKACVTTTEEAVASCQVVGYPAMIKASWGGGGKGIRKVHNDDEVRALFKQVQGEVPGSPIFIMKVASQSRHLEVQLLCDKHGNVAALHSRDCSVQRRHQKIIEEGPITVASPETIKELEQAARRLAKCVQYQGAATVEYLYSMETGEYYFLELNPRLQVEHPVTEWIAEVNLPASQVAVGMGIPLYNIPEIRRFYGMEHGGGYHAWREISAVATKFDLDKAQSVKPKGHCVAVRVTSEDPDDGFKPTSGRVEELNFKSKPNVWAYFSVKSGGAIHEFSDSQFGHVFAFGESRSLAIANMVLGLKEIQIRGEIRTNVDYTVDLLKTAEYRENKIHTGWLDSRIAMRVRAERPPWYLSVVGGALYEASSRSSSVVSDYVGYLSKGQIPPKHISLVNLTVTLNIEGSKYTIETARGGPRSYKLRTNDSEIEAEVHPLRDGGLLMQLDGNSHVIYAETEAAGTRLLINGRTCLLQKEHDPSKLLADTPCKLLRFLVTDGSHVVADTPYAEVEVMKMCMPLLLPASGIIHFVMPEGQAMKASDLIARLDLDDPSSVRKAEPFRGTFPKLGPPTAISGKVHQKFAASMNSALMILAGYEHNTNKVVDDLLNFLDSPELPFLQWQELMSVLATRLPKDLRNELDGKYKDYEFNADFGKSKDFPAKLLRGVIEANLAYCSEKDRVANERLVEPLMSLVKSYEGGRESNARVVVKSLFEEYLSVEELFSDDIQSDVIERLRLQHAKDLEKVVYIVFSHQGVKNKNELLLRLMEQMVYPNPSAYRDQLIRFSALNHRAYSPLALKASQLLEQTKLSELRASIARSLSELEMFTEEGERVSTPRRKMAINERMEDLVCAPLAVEDALVALFDHSDPTLQRRVVETYIRRLYQHYLVRGSVRMQWHRSGLIALWEFSEEHIEQRNGQSKTPLLKPQVEDPIRRRWGVMVVIKSLQLLPTAIEAALKETSHYGAGDANVSNGSPIRSNNSNMLHIALVGIRNQMSTLQDSGDEDQAQERINKLSKILRDTTITSHLNGAGVRTVSCIIQRDEGRPPMRHSFQWSFDKLYYEEEPMLRHVEPPLSTFLELDKVKLEGYSDMKYNPSRDRQWHIYTLNSEDPKSNDQRIFLRTVVRQPSLTNGFLFGSIDNEVGRSQATSSFTSNSILRSLIAALEEIELHAHNKAMMSRHSHMYLCMLREQRLSDLIPFSRMMGEVGQDEETACTLLKHMVMNIYEHVGVRMHRLSVCQWEVKLWLDCDGQASGAWRVVITNITGHTCTVDIYREVEDSNTHQIFYRSATHTAGPLHGIALHEPYKRLAPIDMKRSAARKNETTYCYDFPLAFETALKKLWKSSASHLAESNQHNQQYAEVTELLFADSTGSWGTPLVPVERSPCVNDIGIVAWKMKLSTPEFPGGREIIVVANDVTFKAGSFGPREGAFFDAATKLACERKIPLIYLSATAGARLGVAEEIKSCFHVGWSDDQSPERGFHYIYLTEEDYSRLSSSVIAHELKLDSGETRWIVDTIVGKEDGLGCENLHGSGAIASAFAKAYRETFTLTFVTGNAVGIGAYLARLGMRCIQRLDQSILLTGFSALNKLLGREVYSSQMQLGGPKIMGTNGVVHLTVPDDLEGVSAILKWLSYVPAYVGGPLPILKPLDPPDRAVTYFPENSCDARAAICGIQDTQGKWLGGMFDRESFVETLEGWAKTVITGRAKLGGIPVGVIAVETQTMMQVIPADPGQLDSAERVVPQAGQVWFPDSASKTAQALLDFNHEGLPLFILANWRGFSGGQRDLFEGILQAGSTIVENLRTYKQPAFVYIPKAGELRGGAWVVVDSKINPEHIEMYAERTAKGNVLEPEGLIEIKFKPKEVEESMIRLDPELASLDSRLKEMKKANASLQETEAINRSINNRIKKLMPIYTQVATRFAELHDTSSRMTAKGVISKVVDWEESRSFFYRRLRRRVVEDSLAQEVKEAAGEPMPHRAALERIKQWYLASKGSEGDGEKWNDDEAFFAWKDDAKNYENHLQELKAERVSRLFSDLAESSDVKALPNGLSRLLGKMNPSKREQVLDGLRQLLG